ncbi:hypothetical protein OF83DRAFT_1162593 [Amylostereum chailletii]|nr:hypothetical protein OF83DRAFT_1162593 [Amylostereum chailletii]
MSWIASWFSPKSSVNGRSKALSATQEAFAMPSPTFSPRGLDAYHQDGFSTPEPDSAASYTYPPSLNGAGSYGYVPSGTSRSRPSSLLPLHNAPRGSLPPYPPLQQTWNRLKTWLANEYPELGDTLNYGILPEDLAAIEMQFGFALPQAVRESYLAVDGQEPESSAGCTEGLFFGLHLLPLDEVLDEWRFWREVDNDPNTGAHVKLREVMGSIPPDWVRQEYSQRGWIPLISDKTGNYIGVDLNPGDRGSVGQVIVFGRDFDTKVVLWRGDGVVGWARWLAGFVEDLENGEGFELGTSNESEGSEDGLGYESYFFDGSGRGSGDSNGDAGAGGLKLTGEYRGWNVLEAWADKSVRKWQEAGLLPITTDKGKVRMFRSPETVGLGVLDLASSTNESGAEVAIPVIAEAEIGDAHGAGASTTLEQSRPVVPTISITKPPAPRPVILPTENDIMSPLVYDDPTTPADLESGYGSSLPDVEITNPSPRTRTPARSPTSPLEDASLVSISTAPSSDAPKPPKAGMADITDLLTDAAPTLDTAPIEPSPSTPSTPKPAPDLLSDDLPQENVIADDGEVKDVDEAASTVRLVGAGGSVGVAPEDEAEEDNEGAEANDVLETAELDEFGQLAGKRAKDLSVEVSL